MCLQKKCKPLIKANGLCCLLHRRNKGLHWRNQSYLLNIMDINIHAGCTGFNNQRQKGEMFFCSVLFCLQMWWPIQSWPPQQNSTGEVISAGFTEILFKEADMLVSLRRLLSLSHSKVTLPPHQVHVVIFAGNCLLTSSLLYFYLPAVFYFTISLAHDCVQTHFLLEWEQIQPSKESGLKLCTIKNPFLFSQAPHCSAKILGSGTKQLNSFRAVRLEIFHYV